MKILLVGEYSGLHSNLKKGLLKHGCKVDMISYGDSWKKLEDGYLMNSRAWYPLSVLFDELNLKMLEFANNCDKYDVVQFINPLVTNTRLQIALRTLDINRIIIEKLIEKSKKCFLLAAGDDHYYFKAVESGHFRYNPLDDSEYYDLPRRKRWYSQYWKNDILRKWNIKLVEMVDGVIPCLYEYDVGYELEKIKNKRKYIPFPFSLDGIEFSPNRIINKPNIIHVETRSGFKGTHHVKEAFKKIEGRNDISCELLTRMPFKIFKEKMATANIVIDQLNSYSYAYTAINALAAGKIVISGFEDEIIEKYKFDVCPALVNSKPNPEDLIEKINALCRNSNEFIEWGRSGREYVEKVHDAEKIAFRYLEEWSA